MTCDVTCRLIPTLCLSALALISFIRWIHSLMSGSRRYNGSLPLDPYRTRCTEPPSELEMKQRVLRARDSRLSSLIWTKVSFIQVLWPSNLFLVICSISGGFQVHKPRVAPYPARVTMYLKTHQLVVRRSVKTRGGTPERLCLEFSHQNEVR